MNYTKQYTLEGEARLLRYLLELRFGDLPQWVDQQLANSPEEQLFAWGRELLGKRRSLQELLRSRRHVEP